MRIPPPRPVATWARPIPNHRSPQMWPARPRSPARKKPEGPEAALCSSILNGPEPGRSPHNGSWRTSESVGEGEIVRACTTDPVSQSARAATRRSGAAMALTSPTAAAPVNFVRFFGNGWRGLVRRLEAGPWCAAAWLIGWRCWSPFRPPRASAALFAPAPIRQ